MGARADMLTAFVTSLVAVSGVEEWRYGFSPEHMSTAVAKPETRAAAAVWMPETVATGDRQMPRVRLTERIDVGLLVDVRQFDHLDTLGATLDLEADIIAALIAADAVPGWSILFDSVTREPYGPDELAPLVVVTMSFALTATVAFT